MSDDYSETVTSTRDNISNRVARKSTASASSNSAANGAIVNGSGGSSATYQTRRQAALAAKLNTDIRTLRTGSARFLENFNPETSTREKRKLMKKINPTVTVRRPPGALYDENGVHIATGIDMCDCLNEDCPGCFFPCEKCSSQKCGIDCRVHRKFMYDQIEYHGYDVVIKNPLVKH